MNGAGNFEDIVAKLTQNPEALKSLMGVASSIMGDQPSHVKSDDCRFDDRRECNECCEAKKGECECNIDVKKPCRKRGDDAENLICLLIALKPYVSDDRCTKIDSILTILSIFVHLSSLT